jgi:hypothetical protein
MDFFSRKVRKERCNEKRECMGREISKINRRNPLGHLVYGFAIFGRLPKRVNLWIRVWILFHSRLLSKIGMSENSYLVFVHQAKLVSYDIFPVSIRFHSCLFSL